MYNGKTRTRNTSKAGMVPDRTVNIGAKSGEVKKNSGKYCCIKTKNLGNS